MLTIISFHCRDSLCFPFLSTGISQLKPCPSPRGIRLVSLISATFDWIVTAHSFLGDFKKHVAPVSVRNLWQGFCRLEHVRLRLCSIAVVQIEKCTGILLDRLKHVHCRSPLFGLIAVTLAARSQRKSNQVRKFTMAQSRMAEASLPASFQPPPLFHAS